VCTWDAWVSSPCSIGAPFIAPRGLGAAGASFGTSHPSFVRGCTGLSGAHQIAHVQQTPNLLIGCLPFRGAPDCSVTHLVVGAYWHGRIVVGRQTHRTVWRSTWTVRRFLAIEAQPRLRLDSSAVQGPDCSVGGAPDYPALPRPARILLFYAKLLWLILAWLERFPST
jgi:hypothetical protein